MGEISRCHRNFKPPYRHINGLFSNRTAEYPPSGDGAEDRYSARIAVEPVGQVLSAAAEKAVDGRVFLATGQSGVSMSMWVYAYGCGVLGKVLKTSASDSNSWKEGAHRLAAERGDADAQYLLGSYGIVE